MRPARTPPAGDTVRAGMETCLQPCETPPRPNSPLLYCRKWGRRKREQWAMGRRSRTSQPTTVSLESVLFAPLRPGVFRTTGQGKGGAQDGEAGTPWRSQITAETRGCSRTECSAPRRLLPWWGGQEEEGTTGVGTPVRAMAPVIGAALRYHKVNCSAIGNRRS